MNFVSEIKNEQARRRPDLEFKITGHLTAMEDAEIDIVGTPYHIQVGYEEMMLVRENESGTLTFFPELAHYMEATMELTINTEIPQRG